MLEHKIKIQSDVKTRNDKMVVDTSKLGRKGCKNVSYYNACSVRCWQVRGVTLF